MLKQVQSNVIKYNWVQSNTTEEHQLRTSIVTVNVCFFRYLSNDVWINNKNLLNWTEIESADFQESDFERREEHWTELRRALEDQIQSLKAELKQREEESIIKHKGKQSEWKYA